MDNGVIKIYYYMTRIVPVNHIPDNFFWADWYLGILITDTRLERERKG